MIPAKGEGAAHQLPMPSDRLIAAYLILRPAQGMFDLFVALLNPRTQPVEPHELFHAGWWEWGWVFHVVRWGRQIRDQVPGRQSGKVTGSVVATMARSAFPGPYGPATISTAHQSCVLPSRNVLVRCIQRPGCSSLTQPAS